MTAEWVNYEIGRRVYQILPGRHQGKAEHETYSQDKSSIHFLTDQGPYPSNLARTKA
jgi:hypothetical protein